MASSDGVPDVRAVKLNRGRSIKFDADTTDNGPAGALAGQPQRRLSHTGSIQTRTPVRHMQARKHHWEGFNSRTDAPSQLWTTVDPNFTIAKARELYGGAPRPLSARHEFIKQAFLSDTEDWRSNAHIGKKGTAVTDMNIVSPGDSTYLARSSERTMSYSRERSLKRAISYRSVLVKKDGTLAETQYGDQYLNKEDVRAELKRAMSRGRPASAKPDPDVAAMLGKSLSKAPDRVLVQSMSRTVRTPPQAKPKAPEPSVGGYEMLAMAADRGTSRAVSRIMSRSRAGSRAGSPPSQSGIATAAELMAPDSELESNHKASEEASQLEEEEAPRMEDL